MSGLRHRDEDRGKQPGGYDSSLRQRPLRSEQSEEEGVFYKSESREKTVKDNMTHRRRRNISCGPVVGHHACRCHVSLFSVEKLPSASSRPQPAKIQVCRDLITISSRKTLKNLIVVRSPIARELLAEFIGTFFLLVGLRMQEFAACWLRIQHSGAHRKRREHNGEPHRLGIRICIRCLPFGARIGLVGAPAQVQALI